MEFQLKKALHRAGARRRVLAADRRLPRLGASTILPEARSSTMRLAWQTVGRAPLTLGRHGAAGRLLRLVLQKLGESRVFCYTAIHSVIAGNLNVLWMATNPYRPSKALVTVIDPQGFVIILERNCWYGHILRGHPELRRRLKDVEKALTKPTEIHENLERQRMNLVYYYRCPGRDKFQHYLKVAVWVYDAQGKRAIVTTAHPVVDIPAPTRWYQGKKQWPSSP